MISAERLHELFFAAAGTYPDRAALEDSSGVSTSYGALAGKVRSLAGFFTRSGLGAGTRIALLAPKSADLVAVMLAASAAGSTYIPIDPSAPAERIRFLLRDLDPHALVTTDALFPSGIPCQQQNMTANWPLENLNITLFGSGNHSEDLAFILYTSGSTGQPKGVCITHENALAFVKWSLRTFRPEPGWRFSSIAPLHFDLSVFDLYVSLSSGGCCLLLSDETVKNARLLTQLLAEKKINVAYATPSTWRAVGDFGKAEKFDFSALQLFLFAGEVFAPTHFNAVCEKLDTISANSGRRYFNLYGPTETNVCLFHEVSPAGTNEDNAFPLGFACAPLEVRLANENGLPDENVNEGELLISGAQVFGGYWNRPEKQAEIFVEAAGRRWYRTGDRGRRDPQAGFIFGGRMDRMIKKRGYRIEPGEVENALSRHEAVLEAAVLPGEDSDGYALLIACIAALQPVDITALRESCSRFLPAYMLPDRLLLLPELPKTSSGKIDYQALRSQANNVK